MNCRSSSQLIELEVNQEQSIAVAMEGTGQCNNFHYLGALSKQLCLWKHR